MNGCLNVRVWIDKSWCNNFSGNINDGISKRRINFILRHQRNPISLDGNITFVARCSYSIYNRSVGDKQIIGCLFWFTTCPYHNCKKNEVAHVIFLIETPFKVSKCFHCRNSFN